jgi:hypothetical protein
MMEKSKVVLKEIKFALKCLSTVLDLERMFTNQQTFIL